MVRKRKLSLLNWGDRSQLGNAVAPKRSCRAAFGGSSAGLDLIDLTLVRKQGHDHFDQANSGVKGDQQALAIFWTQVRVVLGARGFSAVNDRLEDLRGHLHILEVARGIDVHEPESASDNLVAQGFDDAQGGLNFTLVRYPVRHALKLWTG